MNYFYKVGQVVNGMEIISHSTLKKKDKKCLTGYSNQKSYILKCLTCGCENEKIEGNLKKGNKCPICASKKVVEGVNDVLTTHPWVSKYIVNKEECRGLTHGSGKSIALMCPTCGTQKNMSLQKLTSRGFGCINCNTLHSLPERFLSNVLKQLEIKFIHQLTRATFEWCENKRYDFYIPLLSCIIETHGEQHYESQGFGRRSLEEEQYNDSYKMQLAIENGISNYITLDCRKSDLEWIKNSIMNSELPKLLNFKEKDVDWNNCFQKSINHSTAKQICGKWEEGYGIKDIQELLGMDRATIRSYLKCCSDSLLCSYTEEEAFKRGVAT